jgi:hypothetical protein
MWLAFPMYLVCVGILWQSLEAALEVHVECACSCDVVVLLAWGPIEGRLNREVVLCRAL